MSGNLRNSGGMEMDALDKRTRFQVNRVDAQGSKNGELDNLCDDSDSRENVDEDDERGRLYSESYDTKYAKSFRHFTREALPRMDNYRNIMSIHAAYRPTLDELHDATLHGKPSEMPPATKEGGEEGAVKFGWVQGVLVRCLLNIWGVMLFLRLSWVVGQAGIGQALVVILGGTVVTTITSLSMSAISTNGVIKGGGTYYMISRSLGPEFGGSIGLIFSLANAVACALYVVGFCDSLSDLLASFGVSIVDGGPTDIRIIGSITILVLTGIVCVGMEWEAKAQVGLLFILVVAIIDFVLGTFIGPKSDEERAKGFVGYDNSLLSENFWPDYRPFEGTEQNFFSVFAIFFPAATGILAGANISGDLADPQHSIPKGTLLAILITTISYVMMAIQSGWTVHRDASGIVSELNTSEYLNCTHRKCDYGLQNHVQVMELVSAFGPLIYAGCFAATLSSALASLVSAPKVFQALCRDGLYPYISWFAKGYGKNNEPVRGYILTFFIAISFILIGELNAIALLISNFFLAAYALINFSTFHASLAKPVGWRPTFKFYNMWLSLFGALLCVAIMILVSWWTAVITLAVVLALYLIVAHRKPDVNWGSTTQAQTYKNALTSIIQLNNVEEHVKNYRPQILVLSAMPSNRPQLIDFAYLLTKNLSLLICGHVIKESLPQRVKNSLANRSNSFLRAHKIKAFYTQVDDLNFEAGAKALLQASGIGKLKPNILLMGYKADWQTCNREELIMYFNILHKAFDMYMAVSILRLEGGLDYSKYLSEEDEYSHEKANPPGVTANLNVRNNSQEFIPRNESFMQMSADFTKYLQVYARKVPCASSASDLTAPSTPNLNKNRNRVSESPNPEVQEPDTTVIEITSEKKNLKKQKAKRESRSDLFRGPDGSELPKDVLNKLTQFQRKQKKGTIDVWWLYDDGGLTLLLPYIISTRSNWSNCKLRVFTLANKKDELEFEQRSMASLLAKFRIDYSDLTVIPDITKKPQDKTTQFFELLIRDLKVHEEESADGTTTDEVGITEAELLATKEKTRRHLRLRELLLEYSMDSSLIVMTLPMPRKNVVSASLYMAWLEVLTKGMPPFLLVRGNQTSVLTFYS